MASSHEAWRVALTATRYDGHQRRQSTSCRTLRLLPWSMARAKRYARWRADAMEDVLAVLEGVVCVCKMGLAESF